MGLRATNTNLQQSHGYPQKTASRVLTKETKTDTLTPVKASSSLAGVCSNYPLGVKYKFVSVKGGDREWMGCQNVRQDKSLLQFFSS